jgi:hypothetical protein
LPRRSPAPSRELNSSAVRSRRGSAHVHVTRRVRA